MHNKRKLHPQIGYSIGHTHKTFSAKKEQEKSQGGSRQTYRGFIIII